MNPTTPKAHRITAGELTKAIEQAQQSLHDLIWSLPSGEYVEEKRQIEDLYQSITNIWKRVASPTSIPSPVSSQDSEETGEKSAYRLAACEALGCALAIHQRGEAIDDDAIQDVADAIKRQLTASRPNQFSSNPHDHGMVETGEKRGPFAVFAAPNQPAQEAAQAAAIEIDGVGDINHPAVSDYTKRSVAQKTAIILKHCFPAPSPEVSREVRQAIRTAMVKWGVFHPNELLLDAGTKTILAAITPFLAQPATPPLTSGEEKIQEALTALDFSQGELREMRDAHETMMRHHEVVSKLCDQQEDELVSLRAELSLAKTHVAALQQQIASAPPLPVVRDVGGTRGDGKDGERAEKYHTACAIISEQKAMIERVLHIAFAINDPALPLDRGERCGLIVREILEYHAK